MDEELICQHHIDTAMKEIKGSVEIDAPAALVWEAAKDFASYPKWNPFMVSVSGELKVGTVLDVVVRTPGRKDRRFPSKVMEIKEHEQLLFKGTQIKGLVSSDHFIDFVQLGPNKTKFSQNIIFKGIGVPLAGGEIKDSQKGLDQMNGAFKVRCEAK